MYRKKTLFIGCKGEGKEQRGGGVRQTGGCELYFISNPSGLHFKQEDMKEGVF